MSKLVAWCMWVLLITPFSFALLGCSSGWTDYSAAQERCANQARIEYNSRERPFLSDYTNHYSPRFGRCVMCIKMTTTSGTSLEAGGAIEQFVNILDVFEHRELGTLNTSLREPGKPQLTMCHITTVDGGEQNCTEEEFTLFVKKVMQE